MKVLFICKGNYFRSQMAEAIYNHLTNSSDAVSAGTYVGAPEEPEGQLLSNLFNDSSPLFQVLAKHGLSVRHKKTVRLTPEMLKEADIVVSMAEEPYIPDYLRNDSRVIWWSIDNPACATLEFVEETYDKLARLIKEQLLHGNIKS